MNALARAVLVACARAGVAEYVVCAGARNAAIAMPLAALSEGDDCGIRVWHFSEERAAGFFALGRARALQRPVAVVTTSGTAVAELLPATVEAFYQQVPILLVTADRPKSFRGSGAPQAIEQTEIFGVYVSHATDVESIDEAQDCLDGWGGCQPVHLNVCLPEPTADDCVIGPEDADIVKPTQPRKFSDEIDSHSRLEEFLGSSEDLVVLLGGGVMEDHLSLVPFLIKLGAPVLAEAVSGYREVSELSHLILQGGDHAAGKMKVGSVLRIGDVPVWRLWRDLESRLDVPVFSITKSGLTGLARPSELVHTVDWNAVQAPLHRRAVVDCSQELEDLLRRHPQSECGLVRWLSQVIPGDSLVFLGNSLPIREWNLCASMNDGGLACLANRGANGIDGILSTALGLGADEEECWIVVGDLTALYDLSAPWVLKQIACKNVRMVVINNGGGRIFSRLPSLSNTSSGQRQIMENAHSIGFERWAAMWGMRYLCVSDPQELNLECVPYVIEIRPDPESTQAFWNEWEQC